MAATDPVDALRISVDGISVRFPDINGRSVSDQRHGRRSDAWVTLRAMPVVVLRNMGTGCPVVTSVCVT